MNGRANPFSPLAVLALVLFGAGVFIALLWMIGTGMTGGKLNNGEAHVGSKGLTGYAAIAALLERQAYVVRRSQNEGSLHDRGLLVLTPNAMADAAEVGQIIDDRRRIGPTLLILPKWQAIPARFLQAQAREGWVVVDGSEVPEWPGAMNGYKIDLATEKTPPGEARWAGLGGGGALPTREVQYTTSGDLIPLLRDARGHALAAYREDEGYYPDLADAAGSVSDGEDNEVYPLIVVTEPDLLNNWGMGDQGRAMAALELFRLACGGQRQVVTFDLTLAGFKRSANLLTLAFQPPFLAATLCLLIAALIAGWRAFVRFGPSLAEGRAIAFGKRALVGNAAGLIRRAGRLHLLAQPYATLLRERLARTLALPRGSDIAATEAAIDRALAARAPDKPPFSTAAARLRAARRPAELLRAGQALHDLERTLTR